MSTQPEALRLAALISPSGTHSLTWCADAAAELRRQHAEIEALHKWQSEGESLIARSGAGVAFRLGCWWADRPWRIRPGTTASTAEVAKERERWQALLNR